MAGRQRLLAPFNQTDAAEFWGYPVTHGRMRKLINLLKPDRGGVKGESTLIDGNELLVGAVILFLWDSFACDDGMAKVLSAILPKWVGPDLERKELPGFLLTYTDHTSDLFKFEYVSRAKWEDWSGVKDLFSAPEMHPDNVGGRKLVSVSAIDLHALFGTVIERIVAKFKQYETSGRVSAEDVAEALHEAGNIRDLIESAYQT